MNQPAFGLATSIPLRSIMTCPFLRLDSELVAPHHHFQGLRAERELKHIEVPLDLALPQALQQRELFSLQVRGMKQVAWWIAKLPHNDDTWGGGAECGAGRARAACGTFPNGHTSRGRGVRSERSERSEATDQF